MSINDISLIGENVGDVKLLSPETISKVNEISCNILRQGVPGILVHIRSKDLTETWVAGVGEVKTSQPLDPNGRWRIACATKLFTTVLCMQLVEEGLFNLDDAQDLSDFLPSEFIAEYSQPITLRHLLSMSSGLPCYRKNDPCEVDIISLVKYACSKRTPREKLKWLAGLRSMFVPGSRAFYTETNFTLIGLIIEQKTNRTLNEIMNEKFFTNLGLIDTSMISGECNFERPAAHGYIGSDSDEDLFVDLTHPVDMTNWFLGGCAGNDMVSSAKDLSFFLRELVTNKLISLESWEIVQQSYHKAGELKYFGADGPTTHEHNYMPYQWATGIAKQYTNNGKVIVGVDGSDPGYTTEVWSTVNGDKQIVIMLNVGAPWQYGEVEEDVAEMISEILI